MIIDFNGVPAGSTFILYGDAPAPFPCGDPRNDYFTGSTRPDRLRRSAEHGGRTRAEHADAHEDRRHRRTPGTAWARPTWLAGMNTQLKGNFLTGNQPGLLFNNGDPSMPDFPFSGAANRMLTLNEDFDEFGRLIQMLGTVDQNGTNNQGMPTWSLPYLATPTENPAAGSTEVWQIMNLTGDVHPIHFHLVNVQLIQRQPFTGDPRAAFSYTGPPTPPDPNEIGWKETVRMNPGEVTTVIMKFDLPVLPTAAMRNAVSPRTGGQEYVWHCHILEHEEHDMMRPLIVV